MKLVFDFVKREKISLLSLDITMLKVKQAAVKVIAPYSHDEMNCIVATIDLSTAAGIRDKAHDKNNFSLQLKRGRFSVL